MPKQKIFESMRRLAVMKGVDVTKERLQIYAELLVGHDYEKVDAAIMTLAKASRFFPDISDFMKILEPVASEDDSAKELAGAILQAISRYGWCNEGEARKYLGELGWLTVERCGGWANICKTNLDDLGTLRAQMRDTAKANMSAAKILDASNLLPYQRETKRLGSGSLTKIDFNQGD